MSYHGVIGVALLLITMLSSCGTDNSKPEANMTLEEAKYKVIDLEQELLAPIPEEYVVKKWAMDTSPTMSCRGEQRKWVGDAQWDLVPGMLDQDAYLDEVMQIMSGREGWTVTDGPDAQGDRRVDLLHEDGTHLMVGIESNRTVDEAARVSGFSACFDLPEYEYPNKY